MTTEELKAIMAMHIQATDRLGFKIGGLLARIFGSLAAKDEEVFWFGLKSSAGNFVDLTAAIGVTGIGTLRVSQEADFVATRVLAAAVNPVSGVPLTPSYTCKIVDGGSDREIMNQEIHVDTLAGTAQRSVPFTKNRLFRRNSDVTFTFSNQQAVATRIFMLVQGYKIFDEAALDLVRRR
jgi:hypothetical protein